MDDLNNALVYGIVRKKASVAVKIHLYAEGGHAFGLRRTKLPVTAWPRLVETRPRAIVMISK